MQLGVIRIYWIAYIFGIPQSLYAINEFLSMFIPVYGVRHAFKLNTTKLVVA